MAERDSSAAPRGAATPAGAVRGPAPRATAIVALGEIQSLAAFCEQRCRLDPLREFLAVKLAGSWWPIPYAEFFTLLEAARGGLARLGVGPGEAVAIVGAPRFEWVVACYAIAGRGAVSVSVAPARGEDAWRAILADSGARVVLAGTQAIAAALAGMRRDLPALAHVVDFDRPPSDPASWPKLLETGRRHPAPLVLPAANATASLRYPAGPPSRVEVTHRAMLAAASSLQAKLGLSADDGVLVLPGAGEAFGEAELHAVFATGCPLALSDGADVAADLAAIDPTVVFSAGETLDRLHDVVERGLASRPGPVRGLLRRGLAAAARQGRGEPVAWLDARLAGLAHRLLPASVRRPLGGRLRTAVSATRTVSAPAQDLLDAAGVTLRQADGVARRP